MERRKERDREGHEGEKERKRAIIGYSSRIREIGVAYWFSLKMKLVWNWSKISLKEVLCLQRILR